MKKSIIGLSVAASFALADVYTLGQIKVQTKTTDDINMIEQSVTSSVISQNNERTISESLDNVSGINMNNIGPKNESNIKIRGHSASRIGVFIDGVPVYVPYDGSFDFGRFLTNDISQIDISKGYSSVAYGANTMGGVINIVTKKPTKELEGNIRGEIILDSDGQLARHLESINVGSKVGNFYGQLSGTYSKRDHFRLSDDYTPVVGSEQPEGDRLHSETRDQKISFKTGYITDDASELALNYSNQKGQKEHPMSIDNDLAMVRYMDSPMWNKETISVSGLKNFGSSYVKALAYYDKSENTLSFYKTNTFTDLKFDPSLYDDYSYGARLEYGLETGDNFLKLVTNYKKDVHRDINMPKDYLDKKFEGHTISVGAEDNYNITKDLEILAGISYDRLEADKVYYSDNSGYQGLDTISALNPQAALIYTLTPESKVRVSASQKAYLPSMTDRYSGGMGTKEPNPALDKETAKHYELGYTYQTQSLLASAVLYFTRVEDAIQSVKTNLPYTKADGTIDYKPDGITPKGYKDQNQNIGDFDHKGMEIDLAYTIDNTKVGGNYSYIDVKNKVDSSVKRTGVPEHQLFAFGEQKLGAGFSLYANMKIRSGMYEQRNDDKSYTEMPSFTTFDTKVIYEAMKELMFEVGVKNITDKSIQYTIGYPEAGREYFATMNYKF